MNFEVVKRLVQILKEAPEVGAIEIRRGLLGMWSSVRVSKAGHPATNAGHVVVTQGTAGPVSLAAGAAPMAAPATHLLAITSPMVGTFYASPEPGAPPYVKAGSRVTQGQVVCIIEAMKIMNEIESDYTGVVKEVAVENMQPVEFGQVLFRVDPHG